MPVPLQFAITLFVSAALLFMVQPMIGRLVLPLVGGSPAAWNTCMVFFQSLLLAGYAYAHALTTRVPAKKQLTIHCAVFGLAMAAMALASVFGPGKSPLAVIPSLAPQGTEYPMFGMLALLAIAVGVPFFVVSSSAPLLQKWFTMTGHPSARDPYFLYAASNAGSLISLLGYPLFIEPTLTLSGQQWVWAGGFVCLFVLTFLCGRQARNPLPVAGAKDVDAAPPTRGEIIRWVALAFVPSSLMLGVTFHMTTDITSMPLLWVPPLALYLLTFIIAFMRLPSWFRPVIGNIAPVGLLLLAFVLCAPNEIGANEHGKVFLWLALHVGVFFLVALMCHTELAHERPKSTKYLTSYFLWMSFGGMLGGIFNGIVAPIVFPSNFEYPIALAVAAFLVPVFHSPNEAPADPERTAITTFLDLFIPLLMLAAVATLTWAVTTDTVWPALTWVASKVNSLATGAQFVAEVKPRTVGAFLAYAAPCMAAFFCIDRPLRFGLCVSAILMVGVVRNERGGVLDSHRSFFGILKNTELHESNGMSAIFYKKPGEGPDDAASFEMQREDFLRLVHGTTLHGTQAAKTWTYPLRDDVPYMGHLSPWNAILAAGTRQAFDMRQEPLTYYHRTGPVGAMVKETFKKFPAPHIAMVGLGSGSAACYALKNLPFTFYEIDPAVVTIVDKPKPADPAKASKQFTYLADARARGSKLEIVLGDARLKLEEQTDRKYPLLLVDAFSSDAIPVHLLTRQAVTLYKERLAPGGLLALHISNKYVDLEPVVAAIANDVGLVGRSFHDRNEKYSGKTNSSWIVLARTEEDLGTLGYSRIDRGEAPSLAGLIGGAGWQTYLIPWKPLVGHPEVTAWTDDYADVLRVMTIKEVQQVRKFFGMPTPNLEDN